MILTEDRGAVRILTLNRPDKLNALNTALTQGIIDAFDAAEVAAGVRAVVLTGAGRGFCAGADLEEFRHFTSDQAEAVQARAELTSRVQSVMMQISKPVVAAVRGAAVGGGAGLALGCDMAFVGRDLKFGYPEVKHSIVPALVMTGLVRALGRKQAFEMISLGRLIGAEEALALGLVNRICDDPLAEAIAVAGTLAGHEPRAMAAAKGLFYRVADLPWAEAMAEGRAVNTAMRAFREPQT